MKIINVVGARPNFMKIAPIVEAMNAYPEELEHILVHTGQHYDERMSRAFFEELGIPRPDIDLGVGSGSQAEQTGRVMMEFERVCKAHKPDLVLVVGDVNSTMACAITAKKLGIKVAHVEAGLRSRDMTMPEEINRLCTDVLCDYLFTTDSVANDNLRAEGVSNDRIYFVGNVMIDTLLKHREQARHRNLIHSLGLRPNGYAVLTLHRPSNVDDQRTFEGILEAVSTISEQLPVIFPMHPRTRKMVDQFELWHRFCEGGEVRGIWVTEPLGYVEFLHLNMHAKCVLTDSGGLQEETTALGIPCLTLRTTTERPVTCTHGTNRVVGTSLDDIERALSDVLKNNVDRNVVPEKWDGHAAERIVAVLTTIESATAVQRKRGSRG